MGIQKLASENHLEPFSIIMEAISVIYCYLQSTFNCTFEQFYGNCGIIPSEQMGILSLEG